MRFWLNIYNFSPKYLHFSKIISTFAPAHQPGCWRSYEAVWFFRRPLQFCYGNLSMMSFTSMSGVITLSLPTESLQAWYSFTFFLSWWEKPAIYVICHSHSVCTLSLQNYYFSSTFTYLRSLFSLKSVKTIPVCMDIQSNSLPLPANSLTMEQKFGAARAGSSL